MDRQPVPQRLCLVLPSSGEFDSRAYRIATTCLERGHEVTVVGRWQAGLPREELHPAGYRILRVPASSIDGLPFPGLRARLGRILRRRRGAERVARREGEPLPVSVGSVTDPSPTVTAPATEPTDIDGPGTPAAAPSTERRASLPRRMLAGLVRRLAIPLTIRSHVRNARCVAPAADLYHGMAYMGIPVALDLARMHHSRVVYDARDIYLEARNLARMRGPARWLLAAAERRWAHRADRVITVNRAYAEELTVRLRVPEPLIVMNCSYRFTPPDPRERRFHDALGLAPEMRVVLYHGGLFPHRGIEQLMEAMPQVDGAALVLMGYGALEAGLRRSILEPAIAGRVHLLRAVPPEELHAWVASADVVAMPIQPSTLNHRLTTPNKLFEAMASGVPVVASDLPGMAPIVTETGCGVLCDPADPGSIAAALRRLLDLPDADRLAVADRALRAAHDVYNWETQAVTLLREYGRLTGRPW